LQRTLAFPKKKNRRVQRRRYPRDSWPQGPAPNHGPSLFFKPPPRAEGTHYPVSSFRRVRGHSMRTCPKGGRGWDFSEYNVNRHPRVPDELVQKIASPQTSRWPLRSYSSSRRPVRKTPRKRESPPRRPSMRKTADHALRRPLRSRAPSRAGLSVHIASDLRAAPRALRCNPPIKIALGDDELRRAMGLTFLLLIFPTPKSALGTRPASMPPPLKARQGKWCPPPLGGLKEQSDVSVPLRPRVLW